jgi:hypothetical protein
MRTMMIRLTAPALLALAVTACGSDPFSPSEESARQEALARWQARPFANYSFEVRHDCNCTSENDQRLLHWHRVEVRAGLISKIVRLDTSAEVPSEIFPLWLTIEGLFEKLRGPHPSRNVQDIRAQYDATLGYPARADFIFTGILADATMSHFLRNVNPL